MIASAALFMAFNTAGNTIDWNQTARRVGLYAEHEIRELSKMILAAFKKAQLMKLCLANMKLRDVEAYE